MRIELRHIATFVAVAETGGLARAAERLHLTQAALSMQLKSLQSALELKLFVRGARGLRLTETGERLLGPAREALAAARRFEQAAGAVGDDNAPPNMPVVIGTVLDPAFIRLGELMRALARRMPQCRPELRQGVSGGVLKELRARRLDLGFYLGDPDATVFQSVTLAPLRYVVIAPRAWEAQLRGRDWAALAALPWIGTPPESVQHRLLLPLFRRLQVRPRVVAHVDQEASMLALVRAGVGLALAREDVVPDPAQLGGLAVSPQPALQTHLCAVALRERAQEPVLSGLFEAIGDVWQRV